MKKTTSHYLLTYLCILPTLSLFGCTQTVTFNEDEHTPGTKPATLQYPFTAKVTIDHEDPAPDLAPFTHNVKVKLPPGEYFVWWKEGSSDYTFIHKGNGLLQAKSGQKYILKNSYLPGTTRFTGSSLEHKHYQTQVLDIASWIENAQSGQVVVGTKPAWADSEKQPQILYR